MRRGLDNRCRGGLENPLAPDVRSCHTVPVVQTNHWSVGELAAKSAGLTVRALHHYDQIGILVPTGRTAAGHRAGTAPPTSGACTGSWHCASSGSR